MQVLGGLPWNVQEERTTYRRDDCLSDYTDLMPQLLAMAEQNKALPPHEVARKFVVEDGIARGGVEDMVVLDKNAQFIGADQATRKASSISRPILCRC